MKTSNKIFCKIVFVTIISFMFLRTAISEGPLRNIIIMAHKGSLENTPENTFAAFEKAVGVGVRGLEIDIRRTKDGKLILMHDDTIDRTTDGKGHVGNLLYDEIIQYDAGSWIGSEYAGEKIPLLSDVLQFAKEKNLRLILNVKEYGLEQQVLAIINKYDMLEQVYFGGILVATRDKEEGIQGAGLIFVPPHELDRNVIDLVHESHNHVGIKQIGYDSREKMKERLVDGVDVFLTDFPSVAIDILYYNVKNVQVERSKKTEEDKIQIRGNDKQVRALTDMIINETPDNSRMAALAMAKLPQGVPTSPLIDLLSYKYSLKRLKRLNPIRKIMSTIKREKKKGNESKTPGSLVRRNAAWALGINGDRSAVGPLIEFLETNDLEFKREIILALRKMPDSRAVPKLCEILTEDKGLYVRYDAARALGEIGDADSVYTLITALKNDSEWLVKGGCAVALGKIGDSKAVHALKKILTHDSGENASWARERTAWALAEIGEGAIKALVSSLGDNEGVTRRRAGWALIKIGRPAIPQLISALKDVSTFTRRRSAMVLGWIGDRRAVVSLSWALDDVDPEVRKMAAWALGRLGGAKAKDALKQLLRDQDEDVVEYAREAIKRTRL